MIRITKGKAPPYLARAAGPATRALEHRYNADPGDFRSGAKKLQFNQAIFGHATVREELAAIQHGKCCYCEVQIPVPYALRHVEHYRPKSRSRQSRSSPPILPGYYWLAYNWQNLFLSCHFCNSSNKGDLFPLANEASRARDHNGSITNEVALILCPGGPEDPEAHITFHDDIPKGITDLGRGTVEALRLDSDRHEMRLEALGKLRKLRDEIIALRSYDEPVLAELVRERRGALLIAQRASSPFSAMAKEFLHRNPIP